MIFQPMMSLFYGVVVAVAVFISYAPWGYVYNRSSLPLSSNALTNCAVHHRGSEMSSMVVLLSLDPTETFLDRNV